MTFYETDKDGLLQYQKRFTTWRVLHTTDSLLNYILNILQSDRSKRKGKPWNSCAISCQSSSHTGIWFRVGFVQLSFLLTKLQQKSRLKYKQECLSALCRTFYE